MSHYDIPEELRQIDQWVGADTKKRPYNPRTKASASVTDSRTWGTFEDALNGGFPHIGFVFTKNDPYLFIDLDTKKDPLLLSKLHAELIKQADSYTETSISGQGSHIIMKGHMNKGYRDDTKGIEIYPDARYGILTGDQFHGEIIREDPELILYLRKLLNGHAKEIHAKDIVDEPMLETDEDVYEKACSADNGEKFQALFHGDQAIFHEYHNDRSRLDMALITMLDFHTKNIDQVIRLFKRSKLYRSEKGRRNSDGSDYIMRTLKQARALNINDNLIEGVSIEDLEKKVQRVHTPPPIDLALENNSPITFPKGLVGEIADYILWSSIKPVPEIALMGALTLMAGIVGRQYNVSKTGLNQYLILLAATGTGKEGAQSGISRILSALRGAMPTIDDFLGPADFASGPAIIKSLERQPCFFSVVGEFGLKMQQLSHPKSNNAERTLLRALLNLYSKSGHGQAESSLVYSDREKNTATIYSPAPTIFGESTPEIFYDALNEDMVYAGLLPRFLLVEYNGQRPPDNRATAFLPPDPTLTQKIADLAVSCMQMQSNETVIDIEITPAARTILNDFSAYSDKMINEGKENVRQLWNRAHLKVLRLAGLISVGIDPMNPQLNIPEVEWAINLVKKDISTLSQRFARHAIGDGDGAMVGAIKDVMVSWLAMGPTERAKTSYQCAKSIIDKPVVSHNLIWRRLHSRKLFRLHRNGANAAIEATLNDMIKLGIIDMIKPSEAKRLKLRGKVYARGPHWR